MKAKKEKDRTVDRIGIARGVCVDLAVETGEERERSDVFVFIMLRQKGIHRLNLEICDFYWGGENTSPVTLALVKVRNDKNIIFNVVTSLGANGPNYEVR